MGKDDFLKLLVTQLKHQDPLKPMEDKEFIAQMAQFSALEQMQNMSTSFNKMVAMNLMGTIVEGYDKQMDENVVGIVTGIKIGKETMVVINDKREIPIDHVTQVFI
jgi:flagellar basal-body rod modification protein FlgD